MNDSANYPAHRGITSELYGGGPELRLQQEMVLGIGGWPLLEALNLAPDVCHLNEGHAALVVLERARSFMRATGVPFDAALTATRAGNIFTTHTAVPAGFDRFAPQLMESIRPAGTARRPMSYGPAAIGIISPSRSDSAFSIRKRCAWSYTRTRRATALPSFSR